MTSSVTSDGAALVTGCSSGIGRATAWRLHGAGFTVYATARKVADLAELADAGMVTLPLDVTDEDSMAAAVARIVDDRAAVRVVVNNAGFELLGPVEEAPAAAVREQFDVNVFGLLRLTQLVLPGMRAAGGGRIVNLSSVFGRFTAPGHGVYGASKHAVAALSEALRRELAPFGIRVALVEPTATRRTRFAANTTVVGDGAPGPYAELRSGLRRWSAGTFGESPRTIAGRLAVGPDDVARVVAKAATARRPRARYPVGTIAHGLFLLRRWLPAPAFDAFVRNQFPH